MKKKGKSIVGFCLVAVLALAASTAVIASTLTITVPWEQVDDWIQSDQEKKRQSLGDIPQADAFAQDNRYQIYLEKASTQEELNALQKLDEEAITFYPRRAMEIVNKTEVKLPRISKEDIKYTVLENMRWQERIDYLNSIAGAPDIEGGSGMSYKIYHLDDAGKNYLTIYDSMDSFMYFEDGKVVDLFPQTREAVPSSEPLTSEDFLHLGRYSSTESEY